MVIIPKAAEPFISRFSVAFNPRTFQRFVVLIVGAILAFRQRTVTNMLRTVGPLASGHWSTFHRVLCRASWCCWPLGKVLAAMIIELTPANAPIVCVLDDTALQHKGGRVYGKGRHHDACRSSHTHTVWLYGHKWIVLAISIKFPFASRAWALPVLCALYRPRDLNASEGRHHKTPIHLARQLMATLIHWFPERKFTLVGDGAYAGQELARFCRRHRQHVTLISRFHGDARLYDPPPSQRPRQRGRRPIKGRRRASPEMVVKRTKARRFTVTWYGGKRRRVDLVSGAGNWYRAGEGIVPVRWVHVHDVDGTHRDEYFYTTDTTMQPQQIVSLYTCRWSIEVTFQEVRAHLGLSTVRNWSKKSVLRTAPCLFGLFSLVSLIYNRHAASQGGSTPLSLPWYTRTECTFSDAIAQVRRLCWGEILQQPLKDAGVKQIPPPLRLVLLDQLSRAA